MCLVNPNHANTQKTTTHVFIKRFIVVYLYMLEALLVSEP